MNSLSILAMAMVIYLFGGYLDGPKGLPTDTDGGSNGQTGVEVRSVPEGERASCREPCRKEARGRDNQPE